MNNDSFRIQDILSQQQQQQLFPTNSNVFLLVFSQTSCFFTHDGIWLLEIPETDSEGPTWQSGLARPQSGKFVWAEMQIILLVPVGVLQCIFYFCL